MFASSRFLLPDLRNVLHWCRNPGRKKEAGTGEHLKHFNIKVSGEGFAHYHLLHRPHSVPTALRPRPTYHREAVEISSKTLKETNMRPPESLAKDKYLSTVSGVVEIYSKALKADKYETTRVSS